MCFSATASFSAGALLLGIGTLTLKSARHPRELPFAAIPLLFAVQQLTEGVIWLTFRVDAPLLNTVMTHVYSFFSHVLWPVYVPAAVWLLEPPGRRRWVLSGFVAAGIAVGAYLLYILIAFPVVAHPTGRHIEYISPHFFAAAAMTLYLVSTAISPVLSRHRLVQVFGVAALLSFATAYYFFATWFISVWCFFAALLSVVIYFHFGLRRAAGSGSAENSPLARRYWAASMLAHCDESKALVQAAPDQVFAHVDDHTRLSSHMSEPSWKMGGGRMQTELDEGRGQRVGSRIRLSGQVLGVRLSVEETVTERYPPHRKVWTTTGTPRLLVIGHYRMGFELSPQGNASMLRVFIEYAWPEALPARWLGRLFGRYYARWCTRQMVDDVVKHFAPAPVAQRAD